MRSFKFSNVAFFSLLAGFALFVVASSHALADGPPCCHAYINYYAGGGTASGCMGPCGQNCFQTSGACNDNDPDPTRTSCVCAGGAVAGPCAGTVIEEPYLHVGCVINVCPGTCAQEVEEHDTYLHVYCECN